MLTCAIITGDEVRINNNFRNYEGEIADKAEVISLKIHSGLTGSNLYRPHKGMTIHPLIQITFYNVPEENSHNFLYFLTFSFFLLC